MKDHTQDFISFKIDLYSQEAANDPIKKAEAIREQLGELVESARDACSKLEAKAKAGLESADHSVRAHPYQAIGIAAAVGLIVGVLISRK